MKNIVIVGNGGMAKEVKWLIDYINDNTNEWNFLGYIDKDIYEDGVIGDDTYICTIKEEVYAVLAIGSPWVRRKIYKKYKENEYVKFPNMISPTVRISNSVQMGEGNIICDNSVLTVNISMGNFNIINYGCTVGHDVNIGNFNIINPGTNISGNVTIDNLVQIGTGTKIIQGKRIGREAVIGAGAVVITDVQANTTVAGVPASVIKYQAKDESI